MKRRSLLLTAAAAAMLLSAAPVQAQSAPHQVAFDGLAFAFADSIGSSVNVTTVPGQPKKLQTPTGPDAPHVAFSLYGPRLEGGKVPQVGFTNSVVRFYRTADMEGYDRVKEQLTALQQLLSTRPDPATLMAPAAAGASAAALPFLPTPEAGQIAVSRVHYVDMPSMSGVVYLTAFRQDVSPITAKDLWYTFQGLTTDGQWYVSATFILNTSLFPKKISVKDVNRIAKNAASWNAYLTASVAKLNAASPSDFKPSLDAADALIASITIDGVPASEPGPIASPGASPAASPSTGFPAPVGSPSASPAA
jgi:hypothetical protein